MDALVERPPSISGICKVQEACYQELRLDAAVAVAVVSPFIHWEAILSHSGYSISIHANVLIGF